MSKRLQVLLDESEMREIRRMAKGQRMTVAAWVRQVLRQVRREYPAEDTTKKLSALRSAARHSFPTADIDQMLAEIDKGYSS